ncbi:MAG: proton-conducting transporter membrane subunit, partial [Methanobacteriota archaeon]
MTNFFIAPLFLLLIAGLIPLCFHGIRSWRVSCTFQAGGGILTIIVSVMCLLKFNSGDMIETSLTPLFPIVLGVDRLSAAFALLLGLLAFAVSLYSPGYICKLHPGRSQDILCGLMPLFLASMLLVLLSRTTFAFLLFWELMAVTSFFLVLIEYKDEKTRYAAFFYLVMTQLSTVCIFLSIICMYLISGSFGFPGGISIESLLGSASFAFLFLGAAIKAGVIPFHKWLPYAHPAAASPVSALMSGMMLNTALYIVFRAVIEIFIPNLSMGLIILSFGCITAVLGVMYALKEQDLKSLLAYSSIDNTGVILIGIGLFTLLTSTGHPDIGMMAFLGTLFHAISHGTFKGLLFLTAGSVYQATGTK